MSPSGRSWTVRVLESPAEPGAVRAEPSRVASAVLRFVSEGIVLDLAEWPANWRELPEGDLVELARRASPPRLGMCPSSTTPPGPDRGGRR